MNQTDLFQEVQYELPYHWTLHPRDFRGRVYFGYMDIVLAEINQRAEKSSVILDAGCGDGRFLGLLRDNGYTNLIGIDYSDPAIVYTRMYVPEAEVHVADLKSIPLRAESTDIIVLIETVEHIKPEHLGTVLEECRRILRKGGHIIVTAPSVNMPIQDKHYQHFTESSMRGYIEKTFSVESIFGQNKKSIFLDLLYKFIHNRYYVITPLMRYYNLHVWPKFCNRSDDINKSRRIICVASKK